MGDATAEDKLSQVLNSLNEKIAWGTSGSSGFDFRSDVITTPSLRMLLAIISTTLQDDVFREDETTISFEKQIAQMTGMETGCFVITGTMANQLALRALLFQPPYAILCDAKAHALEFEAGGPASMSGALVQTVQPRNGMYITVEDISEHAVITEDVHKCPTRVIALENTTSGSIVPLEELSKIRKWANQNDVKLHLDGARIWEAVAAGAGSLRDYCSLFDSIAVDFSKNLGAPMGAMVLSTSNTIHQIRRIRKSIGGGMRQAGVLSSAAKAALEENFGDGSDKGFKLREVHQKAKKTGNMWEALGGKLLRPVETNQVWVDLDNIGLTKNQFNQLGAVEGIQLEGARIVFHHQIDDEAINRLGRVFTSAFHADVL